MPIDYRIDVSKSIVFSSAEETLTDEDLLELSSKLRCDPEFQPGLSQLLDATKVEKFRVSSECIRKLAMQNCFGRGSRRACVVNAPIGYGLARMYQILTDHTQAEFSVFRDKAEALTWLGLADAVMNLYVG